MASSVYTSFGYVAGLMTASAYLAGAAFAGALVRLVREVAAPTTVDSTPARSRRAP